MKQRRRGVLAGKKAGAEGRGGDKTRKNRRKMKKSGDKAVRTCADRQKTAKSPPQNNKRRPHPKKAQKARREQKRASQRAKASQGSKNCPKFPQLCPQMQQKKASKSAKSLKGGRRPPRESKNRQKHGAKKAQTRCRLSQDAFFMAKNRQKAKAMLFLAMFHVKQRKKRDFNARTPSQMFHVKRY